VSFERAGLAFVGGWCKGKGRSTYSRSLSMIS